MRAFRHDVVAVAVATREGLLSPNSVCSMGSANVLFQGGPVGLQENRHRLLWVVQRRPGCDGRGPQ